MDPLRATGVPDYELPMDGVKWKSSLRLSHEPHLTRAVWAIERQRIVVSHTEQHASCRMDGSAGSLLLCANNDITRTQLDHPVTTASGPDSKERAPWVKVKNPDYSQTDGRRELFEARSDLTAFAFTRSLPPRPATSVSPMRIGTGG